MKDKILRLLAFGVLATFLFTLGACGDDDEPAPQEPEVSLSQTTYAGDLNDEIAIEVDAALDGEFSVLRITKFIGTDQDTDFGSMEVTSGLPYTFDYTLNTDGITEPIRINFEVEDSNGLTGDANLVITTNASNEQLLVSFDWLWSSLVFEGEESLLECESDNVWSFDANGDVSLDYGAIMGTGGGSCDLDGLTAHTGWRMNAEMDSLYIYRANAFTLDPTDTLKFQITSFDQNAWEGDETNIFGVFEWTFTAQAKGE